MTGASARAPLGFAIIASALLLGACSDRPDSVPTAPQEIAPRRDRADRVTAALVRRMAAERGIVRLHRQPRVREPLVELGRALAFDPVLSGRRNIACTTCHLPTLGTGDARSLSIGEGGEGLGSSRWHPDGVFIPRNAPSLFNLAELDALFWDGRVELAADGRVRTPAGDQITAGMQDVFEFGAISALGMFPVTNREEMRGKWGSELAAIPDDDMTAIWAALMTRLGSIPEYRRMFEEAYPGTSFDDMTFAHASNAIAGFLVERLTFAQAPWDRFLAGNDNALSNEQLTGAQTFLTLRCSNCHTGSTLSNQEFHNVAVAQFGPGQGNGASLRDDFGRMNVTGDAEDLYRFRTTPLRNVEATGPYGHTGAISTLRGFIEHYSESDVKLRSFTDADLEPGLQGTLLANAEDILATRDTLLERVVLTDEIVDQLMAYMTALTDPSATDLSRLSPRRVPSGLPVDR